MRYTATFGKCIYENVILFENITLSRLIARYQIQGFRLKFMASAEFAFKLSPWNPREGWILPMMHIDADP